MTAIRAGGGGDRWRFVADSRKARNGYLAARPARRGRTRLIML